MKPVIETPDGEFADYVTRALESEGFHCDPLVADRDGLEWWSLVVPEVEFEKAALRVEAIGENYVPQGGALSTPSCPKCGSSRIFVGAIML
jgi:hypothetical protein